MSRSQFSKYEPKPLTHKDVRLLAVAVSKAAEWRGQYVGHEDALPTLAAFDKRIKDTRAALRKVRELKRQGL